MQFEHLNTTDYTPVGDIAVIAMCIITGLLLLLNTVKKSGGFGIMVGMISFVAVSAVTSVLYRALLGSVAQGAELIYIFRILNHTADGAIELLYVMYLCEPLWIKNEGSKRLTWIMAAVGFLPVVIDIAGIMGGFGFSIQSDGNVRNGFSVYPIGFAVFEFVVFYLVIRYRDRIIKQIFRALLGVNAVAVVLIAVQGMHHQSSYTTFSYFIPILGILFMFHSSPYDSDTGAASDQLFAEDLAAYIERKLSFTVISCTIKDFYSRMQDNTELKAAFFRYFKQNIKRGVLYRFPNGRMILMFRKRGETADARLLTMMLNDFYELHEKFGIDYKMVIGDNIEGVNTAAEYMKLLEFIENSTPFNETRSISAEDVKALRSEHYIISELEDIKRKNDLFDPRVLVYCQPVFNILTGKYDTAEALMRLKLPEQGLVFPDKFIPLAEQYDMIHTLSLIILNKTCSAVHELLEEGYLLNRVSVNFSTIDIRCEEFCSEVRDIIDRNDIPYENIAVEITESRSEFEFNRMKQKVEELQKLGIKFYLDDFGTGYSNFERIMEIPFDIIKFDRSMLIESVKKDSSRFMVSTFADMFNRLNYAVLFEGVEDERDEKHCVKMHASYLQGYKYSKPIPIERLREFLEKTA